MPWSTLEMAEVTSSSLMVSSMGSVMRDAPLIKPVEFVRDRLNVAESPLFSSTMMTYFTVLPFASSSSRTVSGSLVRKISNAEVLKHRLSCPFVHCLIASGTRLQAS